LLRAVVLLLWGFTLLACKTTQTTGVRDYSQGIDIAVAATANTPAYHITETVGAAGSGYAYLLEKRDGRWRMLYDSYDAKAFAKPVGDVKEVPVGSEVLWTDGSSVVAYFGTEPLVFSKVDGSFACPSNKDIPGHRACRSQFTVEKSLFDGLTTGATQRPFMLNIDEIQRAITETGIVAIAKKRLLAGR
jgi:hypothetical protein